MGKEERCARFAFSHCCVSAAFLAGCASTQRWVDDDPLEPFNREMFRINQTLGPSRGAARGGVLPLLGAGDAARRLHNVLSNIGTPVSVANDVLQGEVSRAGTAAGRFCVNTTIGVLGVMDPATDMGLPAQPEDFGQTLGVYGVPGGPYVVLPLARRLAAARDAVGRIFVDHYFSPLGYVSYRGKYYVSLGERLFSTVDGRARAIETLHAIERSSVDSYAAMRDAYIKRRNDQIANHRAGRRSRHRELNLSCAVMARESGR